MKPSDIAERVEISGQYVRELAPKMWRDDQLGKHSDGRYDRPENAPTWSEEHVDYGDKEMYPVPEIEMGAGDDMADVDNGHLVLPRSYIRSEYGIRPERLVIMRVRGRSMFDTLRPGQKVLAAAHEGDDLEDGVIYGLRGPLGFTVKRLKFDRMDGEPVIWVWSDNPEESDRRHYLSPEDFEDQYDVVAKALEVGQKL